MHIELLKGALLLKIHLEKNDIEYDDNICLCFEEPCHEDEHIFRGDQTNLYLTSSEARMIANALLAVADESDISSKDSL